MSSREQRRAWVSLKLMAGELAVAEAARLLGLSERRIRRLRARMAQEGPSSLVHGNLVRSGVPVPPTRREQGSSVS